MLVSYVLLAAVQQIGKGRLNQFSKNVCKIYHGKHVSVNNMSFPRHGEQTAGILTVGCLGHPWDVGVTFGMSVSGGSFGSSQDSFT